MVVVGVQDRDHDHPPNSKCDRSGYSRRLRRYNTYPMGIFEGKFCVLGLPGGLSRILHVDIQITVSEPHPLEYDTRSAVQLQPEVARRGQMKIRSHY